jgi:orotate phosphoribosyltransferase
MKQELIKILKRDSYRNGDFTLSSGKKTEHYINCKPVILNAAGLKLVSHSMLEYIGQNSVAVAGLTLGADPLVCGVALASLEHPWCPTQDALIVRKEAKGHGTNAWVEGPLPVAGSEITVLEDVVTTGGSSLKAAEKLRDMGYNVNRIISIVDREEGGRELMKESGIELFPLVTIRDFL